MLSSIRWHNAELCEYLVIFPGLQASSMGLRWRLEPGGGGGGAA